MLIIFIVSAVLFFLLSAFRMYKVNTASLGGTNEEPSKSNETIMFLITAAIVISTSFFIGSMTKLIQAYYPLHSALLVLTTIGLSLMILMSLLFVAHGIVGNKESVNRFYLGRKNEAAVHTGNAIEDNEALEEVLSDDDENDPVELFENALALYEIEISECLIPRREIIGIQAAASYEEIKEVFVESKHSKLIVYENDLDNILGYVHHSDFYTKSDNIESFIREIPTVPDSMTAIEMLSFFKRKQKSIAWVVDQFGGTEGILTTEDLLEELFGEIEDEHDHSEYIEQQISADEFIFSGRLEVEYINDKFDLSLPTESAETLSGYIIEEHNEIPEKDEEIILEPYEFKILKVNKTRIETVRLKIIS